MIDETCWTLVEDAARGNEASRDAFARCYHPVVVSYLGARWARTPLQSEADDAAQEVFVDFMRPNGALSRADRSRGGGGFRAFLFGVARNVARRYEQRAGRRGRVRVGLDSEMGQLAGDDPSPSRVFDRAWARATMRAARARHGAMAHGDDPTRSNAELLRLRFQEGLPIREIAAVWEVDAAHVHRQYGRARKEFARALYESVSLHHEGTPADVQAECARLLTLLQ